jgi:hypothetical protein
MYRAGVSGVRLRGFIGSTFILYLIDYHSAHHPVGKFQTLALSSPGISVLKRRESYRVTRLNRGDELINDLLGS